MYSYNRQSKLRGMVRNRNTIGLLKFLERGDDTRKETFFEQFFTDVCCNATFHGLNHFVDKERSLIEKLLWALILLTSVIGAGYSIHAIWVNYILGSTETVVETTYYKSAQIAFPAVTICEASRIDWTKVQSLNESNLPEYSNETEPAIQDLFRSLAAIEFGEFDQFEILRRHSSVLSKLKTIRISDILLKVMRTCDEVFVGRCWWRSHEIDCCTIFELQKTEFGFCYSFNSDLSELSKRLSVAKNGINSYWRDPDGVIRPRKTGSRGQWSGLRLTARVPASTIPPELKIKPGLKVLVGEPRAYFIGGELTVPSGQHGLIHIWGDRIYSTKRLRNVNPSRRHCLFSDEKSALGLPYYLRQNCKADCYMEHVYRYCNCSPDFMFFEINENNPRYPACTIPDLLCLSENNNIFSNIIPSNVRPSELDLITDRNESGVLCTNCKPDCIHQMYIAELTGAGDLNSSEEVILDIHFRQSTCILYRTDLMFGWLDLLVSFGGCTGLFLGGSILSCFELLYFMTIRLYYQRKAWNARRPNSVDSGDETSSTFSAERRIIEQLGISSNKNTHRSSLN